MTNEEAQQLVSVWARAVRRRTRRISSWLGAGASAGFFGGIAVAFIPGLLELGGGLMVAGGTLLLPALYVSRRANQLAGSKSVLQALIDEPTRIVGVHYHTRTFRGSEEMAVSIRIDSSREASYPVSVALPGEHVTAHGGVPVQALVQAFSVLAEGAGDGA